MMKLIKIIFIFYSILHCSFALAQRYQFQNLNTLQGLASATVVKIVQDHNGIMWFATTNGLSRYDGHQIVNYQFQTSQLTANEIIDISIDHQNRLWVLSKHHLDVVENYTPRLIKNFKEPVYKLVYGEQGLWVSGKNYIHHMDESLHWTKTPFTEAYGTWDNFDNKSWFGAVDGVAYMASDGVQKIEVQGERFRCVANIEGSLWGCGLTGLYEFNNDKLINYLEYTELGVKGAINGLAQVGSTIWAVGTSGIYTIDFKSVTAKKIHLGDFEDEVDTNYIKIMADVNDGLWFSSVTNGVLYLSENAQRLPLINPSLPDNIIMGIGHSENLWASSYKGWLYEFNEQEQIIKEQQENLGMIVNYVEHDGAHWFGGQGGVAKKVNGKPMFMPFGDELNPYVSKLFKYKGSLFAFSSQTGLWKLVNNNFTLLNQQVLNISAVDYSKPNWILGDFSGNLFQYDLEANQLTNLSLKVDGQINDITQYNNQYWISTSNGLYVLENNILSLMSISQGFLSGVYYSTSIYKDHIIATHINHIVVIGPNKIVKKYFGFKNGAPIVEYSAAKYLEGNYLYLGGGRGIVKANLDEIIKIDKAQIQILVKNENGYGYVNNSKTFEIQEGQNIEGMIISDKLSNAKIVQYRYRLEGGSNDWQPLYGNQFKIDRIPYSTAKVIFSFSNDGFLWNPISESVDLNVKRIWYKSNLAIFTYAILVLILITTVFYFRARYLLRRSEQFERQVAERTKTIDNLLKQRTRFFAAVSHEFRTPLTLILGPAKDIKRQLIGDKHSKNLDLIIDHAEHLLGQLKQVLNITQITNDANGITDVNKAINKTVDMLNKAIEYKFIKLVVDISCKCRLLINQHEFEILINNLVSNAIKYNRTNGEIVISTAEENGLVIKIRDSGAGIKEIDRIFEPYYREDNGESCDGNGLGLFLAKQFVDQVGANISVESGGDGSTFSVYFPKKLVITEREITEPSETGCVENKLETAIPIEASNTSASNTSVSKEKPSLVIVEDHQELAAYLVEVLKENYQCSYYSNLNQAKQAIEENLPDLIISDVNLPDGSGMHFCSNLKNNYLTCHIPILILTASDDANIHLEALNAHANEFMTKPFDPEELRLRLQNLLMFRDNVKQVNVRDVHHIDEKLLTRIDDLFEQHYCDSQYCVDRLAQSVFLSTRQFQRKFKALTQQTPNEALRLFRLKKSVELLCSGIPVYLVATEVGFESASYFSKCFKEKYAMSPKEYSKHHGSTSTSKSLSHLI